MSDPGSLERALLSRARGALQPAPADRARVRARLLPQLASLSIATSLTVPTSAGRSLRSAARAHWVALSTAIGAASIVAFSAGYLVGHHSRQSVVTTVVQRVEVPVQQAPPADALASAPVPQASFPSLSQRGRGGTEARGASTAPSTTAVGASPLVEELDLLRRAERTIRAGNSMVALGLLSELDVRFPHGQLLEERAAARVMANCQLTDESSAKAMGDAYLRAHAQSVYAVRVRSLCHLDTGAMKDSPTPGHKGVQ